MVNFKPLFEDKFLNNFHTFEPHKKQTLWLR